METQQLTSAQIAELQKLLQLQQEVEVLDNEISLLDGEIIFSKIEIDSIDDFVEIQEVLKNQAAWSIRTECDELKNNKRSRKCRQEKMSIIDEHSRLILGLGENKADRNFKRNEKIARKETKVNARAYKKTQIADSIVILAQQGIDARSNLAGSILSGIANVAGSVGGAITGQAGQNYGGYQAPPPRPGQPISETIQNYFQDPLTGEPNNDNILLVAGGSLILFIGLIALKKKK